MTVATRLAAVRTETSVIRPGWAERSAARAPEVRASPMPNAIRPLTWCLAAFRPAADAERQPPVRGRVGHGGHAQADQVGRLGRHEPKDLAEQQEQHNVGDRAGHPDDREPGDLQ